MAAARTRAYKFDEFFGAGGQPVFPGTQFGVHLGGGGGARARGGTVAAAAAATRSSNAVEK